jgi:hypothetical protein
MEFTSTAKHIANTINLKHLSKLKRTLIAIEEYCITMNGVVRNRKSRVLIRGIIAMIVKGENMDNMFSLTLDANV